MQVSDILLAAASHKADNLVMTDAPRFGSQRQVAINCNSNSNRIYRQL